MNSIVANTPVVMSAISDEIVRHPDGAVDFVISPELFCHYDLAGAVLWTTSTPRGIPCFSSELLHAMERGSQTIEGYFGNAEPNRPLRYIMLRSGIPKVFNLGGDLG